MRRRLLKNTAALGLFTVAEKGLATARQVLLALFFGAGAGMDALVVGLSVADLFLALLTGSFLAVFIPLYTGWRQTEGEVQADRRGLNLVSILALFLGVAALGVAVWGGTLAGWVGQGFTAEQRALAGTLMPWLALSVWGAGTGVLLTGLHHVQSRFMAPQAAQIGQHLVGLLLLVLLIPVLGLSSVAAAMGLSALLIPVILWKGLVRQCRFSRLRPSLWRPEVRSYLVLFLPLLGAALVDQSILFTDRAMASTLPPGGISALYYANLLWGIPVILLCTNFATVFFPALAGDVACGDVEALRRRLGFAFKSMTLVMLGATLLTLGLAEDLTALFFQHGAFSPAATHLTARTLMALALCLVFQGVGNVVNVALYAFHRTGTVAACGVVRVVLNVAFNALLMGLWGAVGIALSTSLTLALWFGLIAVPFSRELRHRGMPALLDRAFFSALLRAGAAAALAGGLVLVVVKSPYLAGDGVGIRLLRLSLGGGAGLLSYGGWLHLFRHPEVAAVTRLLTARLGLRQAV